MPTITQRVVVNTPEQMEQLASLIAKHCHGGEVITLTGDLGAGKTTFSRGFLHAKGYVGTVKSPTYTIVESYVLKAIAIHHFDLYRLKDATELELMGWRDYVTTQSIMLIEWPQLVESQLPSTVIAIEITSVTAEVREVLITSERTSLLGMNQSLAQCFPPHEQ
jgi:tRNA threonylcarbamoyladenosine biosynthesis protein TsaE